MHFCTFGLWASGAELQVFDIESLQLTSSENQKFAAGLVAAGPRALDDDLEKAMDEVCGLLLNSAPDGEADTARLSEKEIADLMKNHKPGKDGRYHCKVAGCDKNYTNKNYLRVHVRSVHVEGFKCKECNHKPFKSHSGLSGHIRGVHGEEFKCTECDHVPFRSPSGLRNHIKNMHRALKRDGSSAAGGRPKRARKGE